jgi:hypothetical protein
MHTYTTEGTNFITVTGLAFGLAMALCLLLVPRRYAVVPVFILVCYMTMGERILVLGLNFTMLRILLLFGWLRVLVRREYHLAQFNVIDAVVIAWTIVRTVNYTLLWGTSAALVNRLGYAYDIIGAYFLFRFLVREPKDVSRAIRYLAMFVIPLAAVMVVEKLTHRNLFAVFGGVPFIPDMREGVARCQGPFSHPILAGTFAATNLPLLIAVWWQQRSNHLLVVMAAISAAVITAVAGSSGPALALVAGIVGLCFWTIRSRMRVVQWSVVALVVLLQVVMKTPVWFLMARFSVFSGSTGWYRGFLIDMAYRHIADWWLIGTQAAASWNPFLIDVTNQYIAEGFCGGLIAMALFVAILAVAFRSIGRSVRLAKVSLPSRRLAWALGAALFAHAVTFISVTYFDQNFVMLYFVLAAVSALAVARPAAVLKETEPQTDSPMALAFSQPVAH